MEPDGFHYIPLSFNCHMNTKTKEQRSCWRLYFYLIYGYAERIVWYNDFVVSLMFLTIGSRTQRKEVVEEGRKKVVEFLVELYL